jgi:hypothetical protein
MTTIVPCKLFATAVTACAACLDKDPLRHLPGRMRITRTPDTLVLATATRTEKVKVAFRIPCEPGETWVAVVDADGTTRLARALRPLAGGKKNGNATIAIDRAERSLVLVGGGQRLSIPACEPMIEETAAAAGETFSVVGATDLAGRLAAAMTFCKPAEYRTIAKGAFVHLFDSPDGLTIPAVVATDGHRLFVDGDARDCTDAKFVFQVPGDDWRSAAKALTPVLRAVRLSRTAVPQPAGEDGRRPQEKWLTSLVFEAADRRVEVMIVEPDTSLPHWAGFIPRETSNPDLSITCDRDDLAASVKAVSSVSALKVATCMLRADPTTGTLRILAQTDHDGGMAQQEIAAQVAHAPQGYLHLNGKYVLDALGAVRTDRVRLYQHAFPLDAVGFDEVVPDGVEMRPRGIVTMPVRGTDPPETKAQEQANGMGNAPDAVRAVAS